MEKRRSNQILVKYKCGCIGFPPFHDGSVFLIKNCRSEHGDVGPGYSTEMRPDFLDSPKTLTWKEQDEILTRLSTLCQRGHDLEQLKTFLTDAVSPLSKGNVRTVITEPEKG
jgi:hypothetical protein